MPATIDGIFILNVFLASFTFVSCYETLGIYDLLKWICNAKFLFLIVVCSLYRFKRMINFILLIHKNLELSTVCSITYKKNLNVIILKLLQLEIYEYLMYKDIVI